MACLLRSPSAVQEPILCIPVFSISINSRFLPKVLQHHSLKTSRNIVQNGPWDPSPQNPELAKGKAYYGVWHQICLKTNPPKAAGGSCACHALQGPHCHARPHAPSSQSCLAAQDFPMRGPFPALLTLQRTALVPTLLEHCPLSNPFWRVGLQPHRQLSGETEPGRPSSAQNKHYSTTQHFVTSNSNLEVFFFFFNLQ